MEIEQNKKNRLKQKTWISRIYPKTENNEFERARDSLDFEFFETRIAHKHNEVNKNTQSDFSIEI